jgi:hypothetical protein
VAHPDPSQLPYPQAVARYRIKEKRAGISVELTEVAGQQEALLEAFGECQAGQCSCQTDEYEKVASMQIHQAPDRIQLSLEAKPGEKFDAAEIAACLDYTTKKAAGMENQHGD